MQRRIGHVTIESIAAESPKFTAPIVLIHGLWCTAAVWRKFMGYLAHRGWICHALNLRGHGDAGAVDALSTACFADYVSDVEQVIAACEAVPVVVGHDLGGLLALGCVAPAARAVVALAPLVPRALGGTPNPTLTRWATRLAMLRSRPVPPPRGRLGAAYFADGAPGEATHDSARIARELCGGAFSLAPCGDRPTLVVAGRRDRFSPLAEIERLARHVGATLHTAEDAGHAMPWEAGWEKRVAETHRWLIQTLGEPVLAMRDEEEEE